MQQAAMQLDNPFLWSPEFLCAEARKITKRRNEIIVEKTLAEELIHIELERIKSYYEREDRRRVLRKQFNIDELEEEDAELKAQFMKIHTIICYGDD